MFSALCELALASYGLKPVPNNDCLVMYHRMKASDRNVAEEKGLLSQVKTPEQIAPAKKFCNIIHKVYLLQFKGMVVGELD